MTVKTLRTLLKWILCFGLTEALVLWLSAFVWLIGSSSFIGVTLTLHACTYTLLFCVFAIGAIASVIDA